MEFELPPSLNIYGNEKIAKDVLSRIWGKRGVFTCTVANTKTSTIPGISDAGDTPELTMFTGPADAELLINRNVTCMKGIPINPGGIPTPATLTMAALELSGMGRFIVNGGCSIKPYVPYFDMGGESGDFITTGKAVKNVREEFEKGVMLGRMLAETNDFVIVSESCAGGTTTALAVMTAMGVVKENLVSSSSPNNPRELKTKVVAEALEAAGIRPGDLKDDPLRAIECVGDPMMPANVGIVCGAAPHVPVIIGGGTQMGAVIASVVALHPELIGNIIQGTTRWLMDDVNSSMRRIIDSISPDVPAVYVNVDYSSSPYEGLQAYEWGFIKEGVGCGGSSVGAIAMSGGRITAKDLFEKVEEIYREIMGDALTP
ncbi:nicotinate mononucleotide-dependent phosphoribosyltransferase CobT [Candidatus Methanoprimaticola sp. MG2]|uniref:nicotinate mononucleotide-dependent phosphoribosyltransferase CobT n=1 Tax=Candidatus Methanoprimaticola sp. MG2 TaxID=3228838 RepID=UPI0039C727CB